MRKLDRTDIGILNSLQENARITNADLARSVNLSPTPCFNRVKAMEELGLIREQARSHIEGCESVKSQLPKLMPLAGNGSAVL